MQDFDPFVTSLSASSRAGYGGAENNEKLTALFHGANRHAKLKELYLVDLRNWQEAGGGLYCVFGSMGRYSKWGS